MSLEDRYSQGLYDIAVAAEWVHWKLDDGTTGRGDPRQGETWHSDVFSMAPFYGGVECMCWDRSFHLGEFKILPECQWGYIHEYYDEIDWLFVHHPSGFKYTWYKSIPRGGYSNEVKLTSRQWYGIVVDCLDDIKEAYENGQPFGNRFRTP